MRRRAKQPDPAVYAASLVYVADLVTALELDPETLFRAAGLGRPSAIQPQERVPVKSVVRLMRGVQDASRRPAVHLELGMRVPIMAHSTLSSAILACRDPRAAFELAGRYLPLLMPCVALRQAQHRAGVGVVVEVGVAWRDAEQALTEALFGAMVGNLVHVVGQPVRPRFASTAYTAPAHAEHYERLLKCPVEFGTGTSQLVFSKALLDTPIRTANPVSKRLMETLCRQELQRVVVDRPFEDQVRQVVAQHLDEAPSVVSVARRLGVSERTLRRRLGEHGLSFRDLLKQARLQVAKRLLTETDLPIGDIASRLGYQEMANLRKAFKLHTGMSPRSYRHATRAGSEG